MRGSHKRRQRRDSGKQFIILTGPRARRQAGHAGQEHVEEHQGGQEAEDRDEGRAQASAFSRISYEVSSS